MKRSRKNDRVRLLHMRDSASNAIKFVRGMSREDFESDLKTRHAVERATEIVEKQRATLRTSSSSAIAKSTGATLKVCESIWRMPIIE